MIVKNVNRGVNLKKNVQKTVIFRLDEMVTNRIKSAWQSLENLKKFQSQDDIPKGCLPEKLIRIQMTNPTYLVTCVLTPLTIPHPADSPHSAHHTAPHRTTLCTPQSQDTPYTTPHHPTPTTRRCTTGGSKLIIIPNFGQNEN